MCVLIRPSSKATKLYHTILQFRNSRSIGRSPYRVLQYQIAVICGLQHIIQFDNRDASKPRPLAVIVGHFDDAMQRISDGQKELVDNELVYAINNVHPSTKAAWVDLLTDFLIFRASFALVSQLFSASPRVQRLPDVSLSLLRLLTSHLQDSEHDPIKAREYYRLFQDHWEEHSSSVEQVPTRWKSTIKKLDELEQGNH